MTREPRSQAGRRSAEPTADATGAAALREAEARLARVLAISRLGTFEWDLATGIVVLDAPARALWGVGPEVVSAPGMFARVHPGDRARVEAEAEASVAAMRTLETEYRVVLPDSATRVLLSINEPQPGPDGRAVRQAGAFLDVTATRAAEADLRDSEARLRAQAADLERQVIERA